MAHLRSLNLDHRDYRRSENPPVLHRKELLVAADYRGRDRFARLTAQETAHGLFADLQSIGTRVGWSSALESHGLQVRGHRLEPATSDGHTA